MVESKQMQEFFGPFVSRQKGREWVKAMGTATFPSPVKTENVRMMRAFETINGNNWLFAPVDPTQPARVELVLTYQFGKPKKASLEWNPETGWEGASEDRKEIYGFFCGYLIAHVG